MQCAFAIDYMLLMTCYVYLMAVYNDLPYACTVNDI